MQQMGGPPVPPDMPALSAFPAKKGSANSQDLLKMVYAIEQAINAVARAVPPQSADKLDQAKELVRAVLAETLQTGASPTPEYPGGDV